MSYLQKFGFDEIRIDRRSVLTIQIAGIRHRNTRCLSQQVVDDFRACVGDKLESHYRDQATNEDLQAQQDMAFWAFWLLVASAIGIFISGIGVLLIIRSLSTGNNANIQATKAAIAASEANPIMQEERSPWVTMTRDVCCEFLTRRPRRYAVVELQFH